MGPTRKWCLPNPRWGATVLLGALAGLVVTATDIAPAGAVAPFGVGDVFAGVGNGVIKHFSPTGTLLDTLNTGTGCGEDLGMGFDGAGNLYATAAFGSCGTGKVVKFDNQGNLIGPFGSGYSDSTESISIDKANNVYVGQPDGTRDILKFDAAGNPSGSFDVPTEDRGSDWIDLASDQCTMFYTSEGTKVLRYDVCTNTALADFATGLPGTLYALRILPDGGVLVADSQDVKRLDSSGTDIGTYPKPATESSFFFALNLDPDGQHFWTAAYSSGMIYKYALDPPGQPVFSFDGGRVGCCLSGLAVFGESTAGGPGGGGAAGRPAPTLSQWALAGVAGLLLLIGARLVSRRRATR
jgi:hypothetical protein